jgi:hypothetical protein
MKVRRIVWGMLIVCVTIGTQIQGATAFTIADFTFPNSNWTHTVIHDSTAGGGTFTAARIASGGNPRAYQGGSHTFGPGEVYFGHLLTGVDAYDPTTQGPIAKITWQHDFIVTSPPYAVAVTLLLKQNGRFYIPRPSLHFTVYHSNPWHAAIQSLTIGDFIEVNASGLGTRQPDFSSTGAPIEFGYATINGTTGGPVVTTWGIDNYQLAVEIAPETSVGGSVIGTSPRRVICRNLTTGQTINVRFQGTTWNCGELGLVVHPGDRVYTGGIGVAD